jgi:prepilin-type processing-associated H-X9-DG protein
MRFRHCRPGFKLVELIVITSIVGVVFGLILRAIVEGRESGRRGQCQNNMRQIGLCLLAVQNAKGAFPNAGTFADAPAVHGGDPYKSAIYRPITEPQSFTSNPDAWLHSWLVDISSFVDLADFYNAWDKDHSYLSPAAGPMAPSNGALSSISIGILRCPDDVTAQAKQGNLSYVVNGGFARWHAVPVGWSGGRADGQPANGGVLDWTPEGRPWQETQEICRKLGAMFLGTRAGDQPWDIKTTLSDISDGQGSTLLLGENTLAGCSKGTPYSGNVPTNFACPLPNFCMFIASDDVCRSAASPTDCLGGQLRRTRSGKIGPGWAKANRVGTFENINFGRTLTVEGSFPFANSGHPGGSNFLFCDGSIRFLSEAIDGSV